jgi:hypothetical protein
MEKKNGVVALERHPAITLRDQKVVKQPSHANRIHDNGISTAVALQKPPSESNNSAPENIITKPHGVIDGIPASASLHSGAFIAKAALQSPNLRVVHLNEISEEEQDQPGTVFKIDRHVKWKVANEEVYADPGTNTRNRDFSVIKARL